MSTTDIRYKLHHFIETVDDKRAVELYTLLESEIDDDEARRNLVKAERQKYIDGTDRSYSWEEIKNMAKNKDQRNGLQN